LRKDKDEFSNSEEAGKYLVKGKSEYLGGFIQHYIMNEGSMTFDVVKLVTEGPQPMQQQANGQSLDFAQMGAMMRKAIAKRSLRGLSGACQRTRGSRASSTWDAAQAFLGWPW